MSAPESRRGFLRGLAALPLIGGGVTLIGQPSAAAVPLTGGMMATYSAWLHYERRAVMAAWQGERGVAFVPFRNPGAYFHFGRHDRLETWQAQQREAMRRAPIVLAAVGCPLTDDRADAEWGGPLA